MNELHVKALRTEFPQIQGLRALFLQEANVQASTTPATNALTAMNDPHMAAI